MVPPFCDKHAAELVRVAGFGPEQPWQALTIAANIALFQGATTVPEIHTRLNGDISRLPELGCLACYLPHFWNLLLEASKQGIGSIKALGESWVFSKAKENNQG